MTPLLVVSDLVRSLAFYCDGLGFSRPSVHGDPPCFAMIQRDGFDLMLSVATDTSPVRPHGPGGTWDVYLLVDDVGTEVAALRAAGVEPDDGPRTTFYDHTEVEVVDPDGHRICLAARL